MSFPDKIYICRVYLSDCTLKDFETPPNELCRYEDGRCSLDPGHGACDAECYEKAKSSQE